MKPSGSGKLRSATVGGTPQSGGQVVARNVTYSYARSVDPEAPAALVQAGGGTNLCSYVYDAAGNQTEVHAGNLGSTPTDRFVYDGDDQLRRATKFSPGGALAGNYAKTAELAKDLPNRVDDLRSAGVTKQIAQRWAELYRDEAAGNPRNPNAGPRSVLM